MRYASAGDQFVGRTVCGLPILEKDLVTCLPYFDFSGGNDDLVLEILQRDLHDWICNRIPIIAREKEVLMHLMKMLVASIFYYADFLRENLHERSPIRCSTFMSDIVKSQNLVRIVRPWDKTEGSPVFTEIPPTHNDLG